MLSMWLTLPGGDAQKLTRELESLALVTTSVMHGKTYYKAAESAGDLPR